MHHGISKSCWRQLVDELAHRGSLVYIQAHKDGVRRNQVVYSLCSRETWHVTGMGGLSCDTCGQSGGLLTNWAAEDVVASVAEQ